MHGAELSGFLRLLNSFRHLSGDFFFFCCRFFFSIRTQKLVRHESSTLTQSHWEADREENFLSRTSSRAAATASRWWLRTWVAAAARRRGGIHTAAEKHKLRARTPQWSLWVSAQPNIFARRCLFLSSIGSAAYLSSMHARQVVIYFCNFACACRSQFFSVPFCQRVVLLLGHLNYNPCHKIFLTKGIISIGKIISHRKICRKVVKKCGNS